MEVRNSSVGREGAENAKLKNTYLLLTRTSFCLTESLSEDYGSDPYEFTFFFPYVIRLFIFSFVISYKGSFISKSAERNAFFDFFFEK